MFVWTCQKAASCGLISRSRHRGLSLVAMTGFLCAASMTSGADLSQAVVRQKINVVTLAPNLTGEARPVGQGAVIQDMNVVRTGTASKAELEFSDRTITRVTSNAIFTFDAKARAMNFKQGAGLLSKPTNSGAIEFKSGAISGAITGSTLFVSTVPMEGIGKAGHTRSNGKGTTTTIVGMLEGKMHGGSRWTDSAGHEHTTPFRLGPGEMMVARSDGPPRSFQFDIPGFLKSSPLVNGFTAPLPNAGALDRAVADYKSDERRGFIEKTNVMVSARPRSIALVGYLPLDVVAQLNSQNPGFLPVGSTGIIRGQLIWTTSADLDLNLTLPNGQVVSFRNVSVTFNNGRAIALLDHDNLGNTIDVPPNIRVENIVVNGIPLAGLYSFVVNNFNTPNGADAFTLRVFYNGHLQVFRGSLAGGQNGPPIIVQVPRG